MSMQASDLYYKSEYKEETLGKSVNDPAIAYPEHERLKRIKDLTNKVGKLFIFFWVTFCLFENMGHITTKITL